MKSDIIVGGVNEPEADEPFPPEPIDHPAGDPVAILEREMDRRLTRKRARGTPTTLADLIRELQEAERDRLWKESRSYDTSGNGRLGPQMLDYREMAIGEQPGSAIETVSGTSHKEDLQGELEPLIAYLEGAFETRESVDFEELVLVGPSRARVYRALVFLEHRGAIELIQSAIFEPLSVRPGPGDLASADTHLLELDRED